MAATGCAYATLITRASYLPGVVLLAHSLRKHENRLPLVVLYTPTLPEDCLHVLQLEAQSTNLVLHPIEPLLPPKENAPKTLIAERFADTWTKLRVFGLTDYSRVCYLDADMLVLQPGLDAFVTDTLLPGLDWIAANHVCACNKDSDPWADASWTTENCAYTQSPYPLPPIQPPVDGPRPHQLLNGGMFLFAPTEALWAGVQHALCTDARVASYMFPDQDFLADFFAGKWLAVSYRFNALKTMRYWHPDMWRDDHVIVLHYIVDKPWAKRIGADGIAGYLGRDGITHQWWWDAFAQWEAEREGTAGLALVREHVAKPCDDNNAKLADTCVDKNDTN